MTFFRVTISVTRASVDLINCVKTHWWFHLVLFGALFCLHCAIVEHKFRRSVSLKKVSVHILLCLSDCGSVDIISSFYKSVKGGKEDICIHLDG